MWPIFLGTVLLFGGPVMGYLNIFISQKEVMKLMGKFDVFYILDIKKP